MSCQLEFSIEEYRFLSKIFQELNSSTFVNDIWPLVYVFSDDEHKHAYIGEITGAFFRMRTYIEVSN